LHFGSRFQDRVPRVVTQSSKWPGVSWNGMTSAIFVRQKRWCNCFRICRRLPGTRANCRQGSNTRWSTSVTNFRVIRFPRPKRWIRFFGNARRRVFRTVTVRNETRSYLNEPKSRCNGNRRCCLWFEWCGEVELRTPQYENRKSCFFLCLEFRFSE
jgi:hypothetical protein